MKAVELKYRGNTLRKFSSGYQAIVYAIDISIRAALILLFTTLGFAHKVIVLYDLELSSFILIILTAIFIWGLLLCKFIICGKKTFAKTAFDMFFMGIITLSLISTLLSENRVVGVFGASTTWSYSIITFLSIAIIYYVLVIIFKYPKGLKWLIFTFIVSILVPGIYFVYYVLTGQTVQLSFFLPYIVLGLPFTITAIFLFKKLLPRVLSAIAIALSLFLIMRFSLQLRGELFLLSCGVLTLFSIFYIGYWIKNAKMFISFFRDLFSKPKKVLQNKQSLLLVGIMVIMALWIIGFSSYCRRYYRLGYCGVQNGTFMEDVSKISGLRMWLIGKNNLSSSFSEREIINIIANYGIINALLFYGFFIYTIYKSGKMMFKHLHNGYWKNILFSSSIFITILSLFAQFILDRFNALSYILFTLSIALLTISIDIKKSYESYSLINCHEVMQKNKFIKSIAAFIILGLTILGVIGILASLQNTLLWRA